MNVIVTVCIKEKDKFLIIQEGIPKAYGLWNLPGGHLDDNESIIDGAIREAKEETGLDIELTSILSIQRSLVNENIVRIVFNAKKISGNITYDKNEILDCKWITIDEFEKMNIDTLRGSYTFLDIVKDIKDNKNYSLEMIKYFK